MMKQFIDSKECWAIFEKLSKTISGFLLVFLLAPLLGPEQIGVYSFIESVFLIALTIVFFGTDLVSIKLFVDFSYKSVYKSIFKIRLLFSIIMLFLVIYLCFIGRIKSEWAFIIIVGLFLAPFSIYEQFSYLTLIHK